MLTEFMQTHGIELYGVAEVAEYRRLCPQLGWDLPDLPTAVVISSPLLGGVLDPLVDRPTHIYFHHYRQVNLRLDRLALALGQFLERQGHQAMPIAASQTLDAGDLTAHLSHRHMAYLSGMGSRAKNNLLVTRRWGTRVRLVTVLTDAPLEAGRPSEEDLCRGCQLCAKACPAGAIGKTADDFSLERCYALLCEFRKIQRLGQRVCGVCQAACSGGR